MEHIGIRNYGVRPSGGDVFADTVVRRQAFDTASVLALDDVSKQFVALHVVNECAVDEVFAHVVPVHFFAEGSEDLGGAETNVAVNDIISKTRRQEARTQMRQHGTRPSHIGSATTKVVQYEVQKLGTEREMSDRQRCL